MKDEKEMEPKTQLLDMEKLEGGGRLLGDWLGEFHQTRRRFLQLIHKVGPSFSSNESRERERAREVIPKDETRTDGVFYFNIPFFLFSLLFHVFFIRFSLY